MKEVVPEKYGLFYGNAYEKNGKKSLVTIDDITTDPKVDEIHFMDLDPGQFFIYFPNDDYYKISISSHGFNKHNEIFKFETINGPTIVHKDIYLTKI